MLEVDGSVIIDRLGSRRLFADIGLPGGEIGGGGENIIMKLLNMNSKTRIFYCKQN